ncbi:MAG: hypothetical protein LBG57_06035 [Treponema sp.]|nr:hypothetical protein [Treponema sp.]
MGLLRGDRPVSAKYDSIEVWGNKKNGAGRIRAKDERVDPVNHGGKMAACRRFLEGQKKSANLKIRLTFIIEFLKVLRCLNRRGVLNQTFE